MKSAFPKLFAIAMIFALLAGCTAPAAPAPAAPAQGQPAAAQPTSAPAAAPVAKAGEKVTLNVMFLGPQYKAYDTWKAEFEKANPNITLNMQWTPYGEAYTVLTTMIEGKKTPDVSELYMGMIPEYAERGALAELDTLAPKELQDLFFPSALEVGTYNGKLYGLPMIAGPRSFFYNPELLKAAGLAEPKTLDELKAAIAKLNKPPEMYGVCMIGGREKHIMQNYGEILYGFGGDFVDSKGIVAFDSPEAIQAVNFFIDLYKNYSPKSSITMNETQCADEFHAGRVAFAASAIFEGQRSKTPFAFLPVPKGPKGQQTINVQDEWSIFKDSPRKAEAIKFITFISQPQMQVLLDTERGDPPMIKNYLKDAPAYQRPETKVAIEMLEKGLAVATPKHPQWTKIQDAFGRAVQKVMAGNSTAEQALKDEAQKLRDEFAKQK